jgi:citrate lyase subunit beta/citryl-CoA lyase
VSRIAFGAADYCADLGMSWTAGEAELAAARTQMVGASRAARVAPPVDTVWIRLDDADGLLQSAQQSRALGFQGRLCIHPDQVEVVNRVFTPSPEEIEQARRIVAAYAAAGGAGAGAIRVDGLMVDVPVAERAQRTLDLAGALATRGAP